MICNPITCHNITQDVFDCMKQKISTAGYCVPDGNSGQISVSDVKADFSWDGVSSLTVTIISMPFLISCEMVSESLQDFVSSCGGTSLSRAMNIKNLRRKLDDLEKRGQILEEEDKY
jgi:hypothetical protein